ncbi:JAB domain-containing protein [Viridibacillus sp. FSL H7-0596]|uniref:JAB domain-containing protein n=1 Tax=Viridibacillus sp. FSL H7-0596 TaxID=1928923 RepID=UPI0009F82544|nr:JAB domain-containing protein [Viridibacillus sp. FSL H7-0596]
MIESKKVSKRVDIVRVQLVKERSLMYSNRKVKSPQDGAELFREFLGEVDREHFLVMCLNTKNEPTHLNTVHIGSLNASIVHPREVA